MAKPLFKMRLSVEGLQDLLAGFDKLERRIQRAVLAEADDQIEDMFNLSQERVPVKSGALRASGKQIKARFIRGRKGIEGAILYRQKYSLEQHEVPFPHDHGQWKYLSSAIEELKGELVRGLAVAIGRAI